MWMNMVRKYCCKRGIPIEHMLHGESLQQYLGFLQKGMCLNWVGILMMLLRTLTTTTCCCRPAAVVHPHVLITSAAAGVVVLQIKETDVRHECLWIVFKALKQLYLVYCPPS